MIKAAGVSVWIGAIMSVLITVLYLGNADGTRPFHPKLECAGCHLAGQDTNLANAAQLTSSEEALCGRCHRNALEFSHPSGFTPARKLPATYPLDWKGDMTCSSCHNIHQGRAGLLRGEKHGQELCLTCHSNHFFAQMADKGISLQRLGHLSARLTELERDIDPYSVQCLGCHINSGDAPNVNIDRRGVLRHSGGVNHPIGSNYERARRSGGYRPFSQLQNTIKLPQGKVGCVSCHVGYSKRHGALVMSNQRSALCLECHDL